VVKVSFGSKSCRSEVPLLAHALIALPGHHVEGGSFAEIFCCRRATKWLLLYAYRPSWVEASCVVRKFDWVLRRRTYGAGFRSP
jgi:hypothetical protein